jgi:hypothetical protein
MRVLFRLRTGLQIGLHLASLVVGLLLFGSCLSFAQVSSASLNGTVKDPQGSLVPNATVVLRNVNTSVESPTVTNGTGAYIILSISPGQYTVIASAAGFSSSQVPAFTLTVGQVATIDFALKVGTQTSVVTVEGSSPQLEVSSANLGTVISTQQVNDLPLNGRNFTQLLLLTPGVSPVNTGQNGNGLTLTPTAQGSAFSFPSINGQTNRSNFFLTDGLNNYGTIVSTYNVPPIIDAIQEFKVVSHTDSAEFGSALGGVVNVVSKSGTNDFHGSAWEYARNAVFDARSYFLPKTTAKTPYSQHQYGASIGGPLWIPKLYNGRNKTFFFGAYQGFRYSQTSNTPRLVPTAAQLAGDESSWGTQIYNPFSTRPDPVHPGQYIRDPFPGNQIPANLIDQRMVAWAHFVFPAAGPAFDAAGDNVLDTSPLKQTQNEWTARVDQNFGPNNSGFFRYSFINSDKTSSGGLPGAQTLLSVPARNWGGSFVHIFGPSLILQLQFAKTTAAYLTSTFYEKSTSDIFSTVGFNPNFAGTFTAAGNGRNLLPGPSIAGYSGATESIRNYNKATDSNQYSGTLTKLWGRQEIHTGGGYTTAGYDAPLSYPGLGFSAQQTADTNPLDTVNAGSPLASFLLNVPDNALRRNIISTERPGGVLSAFVQDSWRATDKLTLNFGLRYDLTFIPPYGRGVAQPGQQGGIETGDYDFSNGTYILQKAPPACSDRGYAPCLPGDGSLPAHVVVDARGKIAHNVYDNFGPRFGFAYRLDDKTVVRGAFGIVYDNWAAVTQTSQNIEGLWPGIGQLQVANLNQPTAASPKPTITAQDPFAGVGNSLFPAATPFNQVSYFFDPHMKNPRSEQWNVGAGRLLNQSTTLTMNYVGSVSDRLDVGGFYNTALTPGPGAPQARALYPYIKATNYDRSTGYANYNALQLSLDKRHGNGLAYQVAYTWSKSINVGGDGWYGAEGGAGGGVPVDPYHPAAYGSRSVAGNDLRHILTVNALYQLPVGRGKSFSTGNGVADYLLGNWQFNGIFSTHSGLPFTPYITSDIANTGNNAASGYEHANLVGNPNAIAKRTPAKWFNTAAFAVPPGFTYGTAARNSLRSDGYWNVDASLFRLFPIGGERKLEFRAESFNIANTVSFGKPNADLNSGVNFGTINTTANSSRSLQFGAKFIF